MNLKNHGFRDFPGGPVVKNLPSNAGNTGLIPGPGSKIPHATGQQSPCTTASYRAYTPQLRPDTAKKK